MNRNALADCDHCHPRRARGDLRRACILEILASEIGLVPRRLRMLGEAVRGATDIDSDTHSAKADDTPIALMRFTGNHFD